MRREPDLYVLSKCVIVFAMFNTPLYSAAYDKIEVISFYDIPTVKVFYVTI